MTRNMTVFSVAAVATLLAGCGSSKTPSASSPAAKPDVTVTVDAPHHTCVVAKFSEPTGSSIACTEVVSFIRDELRVHDGAAYDLRSLPPADEIETSKVKAALDGAGFRFVGAQNAPG